MDFSHGYHTSFGYLRKMLLKIYIREQISFDNIKFIKLVDMN